MKKDEMILIVEDQFMSRKYLEDILNSMGYFNTYAASNAKDALEIANTHPIELVFMDINLDGPIDGIQCAFTLNEKKVHPIIYISAYTDTHTIAEAGDTNFYGYICKPYDEKDVAIAIQVAKKHIFQTKTPQIVQEKIKIDSTCTYDTIQQVLLLNQKKVPLTKKEITLLEFLIEHKNKLVSYDDLKRFVWKNDVSESTIRDSILRLRKKAPLLEITNRFGMGYLLQVEQQ